MIYQTEKNVLSMYKGDTGSIGFKISGFEQGDSYLFAIKENLEDSIAIYSQTFSEAEFVVNVSSEVSAKLLSGTYYWGLKLFRANDEIDTLIGKGVLNIEKGV